MIRCTLLVLGIKKGGTGSILISRVLGSGVVVGRVEGEVSVVSEEVPEVPVASHPTQ